MKALDAVDTEHDEWSIDKKKKNESQTGYFSLPLAVSVTGWFWSVVIKPQQVPSPPRNQPTITI
jgi:hypothetical protein